MVARSCELFVRKTVCITAEVSAGARHRLVVEVIMTIDVLDDIAMSARACGIAFHLAAGVGRTVDIEVFKQTVGAGVMQIVLTRIAQRQVLDMQVGAGVLDL